MADRSITVKIGANVSGFVSGMKTVAQATQDAANKADGWVQSNKQGINDVSNMALGAGVALTGFALVAANTAANFDAAMSSVQAATMETSENMAQLREAAIEAGASTSFSATEAAAAIEELAKAGLSTADILGGGLAGALDLAASDGIAVAEAAEIASAAMVQFGLSGRDVSHIADLLAAGAGKALGSVTDLGQALNQSGLVASQMGLSIEETTGSLAMFAESGLIGSDAGTSFRSMLLRLANPTKESAQLMEDLGLRAYDAGGQFVGMENLAGQLQDRLGHLTQEQRNQALATIFGQDAIRAAAIAFENGAEGVRTWESAVNDQGYAAEQAAIRLDNLKGDLEGLSGAWETAMINLGSTADGPLRSVVQAATDAVNALGEMSPVAQGATMALVGGGGLVALGVGGLGKLAIGISDARNALSNLGISMKTAGLAAGGLGAALAIGTVAFAAWANAQAEAKARTEGFIATLDEFGNRTDDTLRKINEALAADTDNWFESLMGDPTTAIDQAERYGLAVEDLQGYILGQADAIDRVNAATQSYAEAQGGITTREYRNAIEAANQFTNGLDMQAESLTEAERVTAQKALADREAGLAAEDVSGSTSEATSAIERYTEQQQTGIDSTETYTEALEELIDAQREAAGVVLSVRDAQRNFEEATAGVSEALEQQIDDLARQRESQGYSKESARAWAEEQANASNKLDITTEAGRRNQAALDNVADSGWSLIDSMRANGATQDELQATMQTTRDRFLEAAGAMGMGADEANALADELGLIPSDINVNTHIRIDTGSAQAGVDKFIRDNNGRTLTFNVATSGAARVVPGGPNLMKADGGYISGPGTGTSDSIPAWLSNGEFVVKASSVAKYGTGLLHDINAGRFANGGEVSYNPRPVMMSPMATSSVQVAAPAIDLAGALDGVQMTLVTEAGPLRGFIRTEAVDVLRTASRGRGR